MLRSPLLPAHLQRLLNAHLEAGEKVAWAAQPGGGLARRVAVGMFVFGLVWMALVFAMLRVILQLPHAHPASAMAGFFIFVLGLFAFVGMGMLTAPLWLAGLSRNVVYAVTDRRAIIVRPAMGGNVSVESYSGEQLGAMEARLRPDGSGNLIFFRRPARGRGPGPVVGFIEIQQVREVEALVRSTLIEPHAADSERRH